MQTNITQVSPEDLQRARSTWDGFKAFMKYGIVGVAAIMLILLMVYAF